jgi:hypothetical protein
VELLVELSLEGSEVDLLVSNRFLLRVERNLTTTCVSLKVLEVSNFDLQSNPRRSEASIR